jgi:hypothetical protein
VFARNAVTAATGGSGADVSVSGVAQPLATGVALSATDGGKSTPAVTGTLAADGTWTATLPVSQLAGLTDGTIALSAVFAVPDVATGSAAHITGVPLSIRKQTVAGGVSVTPDPTGQIPGPGGGPPASPSAPAPAAPAPSRLSGLRATRRISLAAARRGGIRVSFVVPTGASVVRVRLSRGGATVLARVVPAGRAGARQTVRLESSALARRLRRGSYRLGVAAGPSRSRLGRALTANVRVR